MHFIRIRQNFRKFVLAQKPNSARFIAHCRAFFASAGKTTAQESQSPRNGAECVNIQLSCAIEGTQPLSRQSPPEHILKTPRAQPSGGLYFIVTHSQDLNYFFKNFKSRLNCVAIEAPMALDRFCVNLKNFFRRNISPQSESSTLATHIWANAYKDAPRTIITVGPISFICAALISMVFTKD